jgi:hypothetical protein
MLSTYNKGKVLGPLGAYIKINEGFKDMGLPIEKVRFFFSLCDDKTFIFFNISIKLLTLTFKKNKKQ